MAGRGESRREALDSRGELLNAVHVALLLFCLTHTNHNLRLPISYVQAAGAWHFRMRKFILALKSQPKSTWRSLQIWSIMVGALPVLVLGSPRGKDISRGD